MPFTPYHVGPALLVALLLYPLLDIPAFIVASLVLDFEPLLGLFGLLPWSPHGVFHSFTMGIPVSLLVTGGFYLLRKYYKPIKLPKAFSQEPSIRNFRRGGFGLDRWGSMFSDQKNIPRFFQIGIFII